MKMLHSTHQTPEIMSLLSQAIQNINFEICQPSTQSKMLLEDAFYVFYHASGNHSFLNICYRKCRIYDILQGRIIKFARMLLTGSMLTRVQ